MVRNILLCTDVYKMGHMEQYCPGTDKVYSYLTARGAYDKQFDKVMWFGLKYYLQEYLTRPVTSEMVGEFIYYREKILGSKTPEDVVYKLKSLVDLGYWPLKIKSLPEGYSYPFRIPLMTMANTIPEFYWCVGFLESLLLKTWYPSSVATYSRKYREVVDEMYDRTVSEELMFLKDFAVHDFGYRGDSSEESAGISGSAHLLSFKGSDTVSAYPFSQKYYPDMKLEMHSVPASEHSVMCSFGEENELQAFEHMLDKYPTGIVSIVSDTYSIYRVLSEFATKLRPKILKREGKVVFRPDSGDPLKIICGDALNIGYKRDGCLRMLDEIFGSAYNKKGYRELNPKVGLIYGDGMYLDRYSKILRQMESDRYSSSNLVIGVGGILRHHTRDTFGFTMKATYVEVDGKGRDIYKNPVTDTYKKSLKGLLKINHNLTVTDQCSLDEEQEGLLQTVFENGKVL